MKKKPYFVTTPIYYPNDIPHIGHAYSTLVADVIARWQKLQGKDVIFSTGTDEHGQKIQEAAEKQNKKPKAFVDELVPKFKDAWKKLGIQYTRFIRTTDKDHEQLVKDILQQVYDNGDIYLSEYTGHYCVGCERYFTEKELEEGNCPIHKTPAKVMSEPSYFFKLSTYQKQLLKLYKEHPGILEPKARRNEVIKRIEEGLNDISISRASCKWGIPLPFDTKHVTYVWFDALFNYYTASQEHEAWPADIHIIGKDILWFHAVYWPAFLLAANIELPKQIFAHGFWTFNNEKISKSRGKVINVDELVSITNNKDSVRYFLLRQTAFGDDGDFSSEALIDRHNNELSNKLGNLVSRVTGLIEKYGVEKTTPTLKINAKKITQYTNTYQFDKALNEIFAFIDSCNEYIQASRPWETKSKEDLYQLANAIKQIAIMLSPFIPDTTQQIAQKLNIDLDMAQLEVPINPNNQIVKGNNLFEKIEKQNIKKEEIINEVMQGIVTINFEDWQKVDLRVGEIEKAEHIADSHKLFKLTVNMGHEERTIVSGLREYYTKEDLQGMKVIVIANLKSRKMRGVESQGMILAAVNDDESKVVLISPSSNDIENGSKVM